MVATLKSDASWNRYKSGFLDTCYPDTHYLHAVVILGYTSEAWLLKNSWGTGWGENGYFKIKRGVCSKITNIDYPEY